LNNKEQVARELIFEEVVRKRDIQLDSIVEGLKVCKFYQIIQTYPDMTREIFVIGKQKSPLKCFLDSVSTVKATEETTKEVISWFREYLLQASPESLEKLLQFCTAKKFVPSWGLNKPIVIKFLKDDEMKQLPEANVCFNILSLPTVLTSKSTFFKHINIALDMESSGFSAIEID